MLNRSKTSVRGVVAVLVFCGLVVSLNEGLELELKLLGVGEVELELEIDCGAAGGKVFDAVPADFKRRVVGVDSERSFCDLPSFVEVESDVDGFFFM